MPTRGVDASTLRRRLPARNFLAGVRRLGRLQRGPELGAGHGSLRSSSAVRPAIARMLRNVPLAMSRPGWTGTTTVRPSECRMTWWLPLILTTANPGTLERLNDPRAGDCRNSPRHQATSSVSVSSGGGPTSSIRTASASRRSSMAASFVGPSPTAPTPGRSWADAHHTPSSS